MFLTHLLNYKTNVLIVLLCSFIVIPVQSLAAGEKTIYIRAGAGISLSSDTEFVDIDCQSSSPAALFGCSSGNDGRATGAYGDFKNSGIFDLGIGYNWNRWFRSELSLSYRPGFQFEGQSNFSQVNTDFKQAVEAEVQSFSAMVSGVLKPMALFQMKQWKLEPLLFAGLGLAHNRLDSMVYTFPTTATMTPDGSNTDFSWSIGAGFSYEVLENIELELMYRYSDLGKVSTDVEAMTIVRRSSNAILNDSIVINETEADLEVNELLLSIILYF